MFLSLFILTKYTQCKQLQKHICQNLRPCAGRPVDRLQLCAFVVTKSTEQTLEGRRTAEDDKRIHCTNPSHACIYISQRAKFHLEYIYLQFDLYVFIVTLDSCPCVALGAQIFGRIYDDACVLRLITCTHYFEQQELYMNFYMEYV